MSRPGGIAVVAGAMAAGDALRCLARVDAHPVWRRRDAAAGFDPYSSSLRADAVADLDLRSLAAALLAGPAGPRVRERLGDAVMLAADRCWVRRQYPPDQAPPQHAPHGWHQDGALAFDFLAARAVPSLHDLLDMVTCWIALVPCGEDAPGLELVDVALDRLLVPAELADAAVRARHPADAMVRPVLASGDALVFGGEVLHHTRLTADMRRPRTSLELRFFAAGRRPLRLADDRFLDLS